MWGYWFMTVMSFSKTSPWATTRKKPRDAVPDPHIWSRSGNVDHWWPPLCLNTATSRDLPPERGCRTTKIIFRFWDHPAKKLIKEAGGARSAQLVNLHVATDFSKIETEFLPRTGKVVRNILGNVFSALELRNFCHRTFYCLREQLGWAN